MLTGEPDRTFRAFYQSARRNAVFDERTTVLLHLAAAEALGCEPCMRHYLSQAGELGLGEAQLSAVQAIVMAVAAGRIGAQLREAQVAVETGQQGPATVKALPPGTVGTADADCLRG